MISGVQVVKLTALSGNNLSDYIQFVECRLVPDALASCMEHNVGDRRYNRYDTDLPKTFDAPQSFL
jgi:hypothetical protein